MFKNHFTAPPGRGNPWAGVFWLALLIGSFLLIDLLTITHYPTVWQDEDCYTDPAANCYFGHGFTSTAWPAQPYGQMWAGNVPLHQWALIGWFHVFGFSLASARAMNGVLMAAAAAALWLGFRRMGLIKTNRWGALAVAVILCCSGITMSYRSARPDCIGIFLAALAFLAFTLPDRTARRLSLAGLGLLLPVAGLQLVVFAFLLGLVLAVFTRGRQLWDFASLGAGILLGLGGLAAFYAAHGVLEHFVVAVTKYSDIGTPPSSLGERLLHLMPRLTVNKSQLLLAAASVLWLAWNKIAGRKPETRPLVFALIAWLAVTTGMTAAGKYPVYYSWMTNIPLVICLVSAMEGAVEFKACRRIAVALLFLAAALGLPLKLGVSILNWSNGDATAMESYVHPYAGRSQWVYADYPAYFALKNSGNFVVLRPYLETITDNEKSRIKMVVVSPPMPDGLAKTLGGEWKPVAAPLTLEWPAVHNPNLFVSRMARHLTEHPQDAGLQLCIYERLPETR